MRVARAATTAFGESTAEPAPAPTASPAAAPASDTAQRDPRSKSRHLDVCLHEPVDYAKSAGFDDWDFVNDAMPEVSLEDVDLSTNLAGRRMQAPLMIAPMTGGTPEGLAFNRRLAAAAQHFGLAMGVGSQRVALERAELAAHFRVRDLAPDIPLFANFGAGQLARGWGADEARRAVAMIGADAIHIHFNAVQEAIQGGDRDFRDIAVRLTALCRALEDDGIPVFAREVGFGMSGDAARRLRACGVAGVDCAGAGGTSWAKVEAFCAATPQRRALGFTFGEWGTPTARCIVDIRRVLPDVTLIATGGLRTGIDLAKAIALGADVGAMARPMLKKAHEGEAALHAFIETVLAELRVCLFGAGAANLAALRGCLMPVGSGSDRAG
jgi:isopentenyl-diphosphate Delta-isomerase